MGIIKIKENFLDKNLINFLNNYFLEIPHYYGHSSNKDGNKFYSHFFNVDNPLINFISKTIEENIKILEAYINVQYTNMDGDFHTDEGNITHLLMVSKTLINLSGCFQTMDENNNLTSYNFVQNRLISFPAKLKHRGLAPLEKNSPRITLVFKTNNFYE
jgi:hypothetical protein